MLFLHLIFVVISLFLSVKMSSLAELVHPPDPKGADEDLFYPPYFPISLKAENYILPILPYNLADLEPVIDKETGAAHYYGHHEAYRNKMNIALRVWREKEPENQLNKEPIVEILRRIENVPEEFREKLKNNVGGFVNHAIYWAVMSPNPEGPERIPTGSFRNEIEQTFGSYETFKTAFSGQAVDLFGSGYVWLVRDRKAAVGKQLLIVTSKNQDSPISHDLDPLLVIDVWEHAYYLRHQFRRVAYVTDWWRLVDWKYVEELDGFWTNLRKKNHEEL